MAGWCQVTDSDLVSPFSERRLLPSFSGRRPPWLWAMLRPLMAGRGLMRPSLRLLGIQWSAGSAVVSSVFFRDTS